jgi:hypothetical protein
MILGEDYTSAADRFQNELSYFIQQVYNKVTENWSFHQMSK